MSGVSSGLHTKGGESAYVQYVRYVEKTSSAVQAAMTEGTVEHFAQGYQDYLQNPLQVYISTSFPPTIVLTSAQPLMDNLQSITYQTFEQDPVKYRNYEEVCVICYGATVYSDMKFAGRVSRIDGLA